MQHTTTKHCKQHCGFAVIILYIQYVVYKDSKAILSFLAQALMGIGQGHTLLNVSTFFNPLTPMSDQEKASPYNLRYNFKQKSDENKVEYDLGDFKLIQY